MTDVPIIDRTRLDRVCMGKPEMAREFIDALIDEATPIIASMPASLAARERSALRESAHAVKGTAGNVGAARLQAAAMELERSASGDAGEDVLAVQVDAVIAALAELRGERDTAL